MGVSGCGKTTLAQQLAQQLGCAFIEGDALHSPSNIAKMSAGTPLTDEDRWPWLAAIAQALNAACASQHRGVATCSALKRSYRDYLRQQIQFPLQFVFLDARKADLLTRLEARQGHFMPSQLLESQLQTLERPSADENVLRLWALQPIATLLEAINPTAK
jgi:gluconokinase